MVDGSSVDVYTATRSKSASGTWYAFGRERSLHGKPSELGGYALFALRRSYSGSARGGIANSWALVERGMSYERSVELMNRRLGREEFALSKRGG